MNLERISYTVPQAATATGISANEIRAAIKAGLLIPRRPTVGKGLRVILATELYRWINESPIDAEDAS